MVEKNSSSLNIHGTSIRASASTSTNNEDDTITAVDIADYLPIELIKSEIVPPSPNPSNSTSDWLQDFLGLSWIAYAASSLLVISHFPSPLSKDQTLIGPIFRQAIELSNDESAVAMAVAWSPLSPSKGDVAAAIGNCICLCSESSGGALGTLCWGLNTVLKQSHVIEAIRWTGSGDGVVTAGVEIVLWRRKDKTWEIAWKCEVELPQTLVSATWSAKGPVATAIYPVESSSLCGGKSRCVLVWENGGKSGVVKSELRHPQPVSMIQWRPSNGMGSQRAVLLTCCLDGTMRLWCEIDGWRGKKIGKEPNEQKALKRSFHVISVIEVNQSLNGSLGTDIFATWAVEFGGLIDADETSKSDLPGKCEWLIGFRPGGSLTLWALHCLDDLSPLRFPRVTLWKKQQITGFQGATALECKVQSFVTKTVISRRQAFGPPTTCSLFQFLSDNSMRWLQYTPRCNSAKDGFLCIDGHTGRMLQIDVHPCSCEVGLAASLDSNGLVLLWSLSTVSSCNLGMPTFGVPTWKILGKLVNQDSLEYSSVRWAPLIFNDLKVLLLSHLEGIDCFIVNLSLSTEVKTQYHKLCTIPFSGHSRGIRPINIFALPLHSTCEKVSITNKFMLLAVWMGEFQAISWEVAFHFADLSQSRCACTFDVVQDNGERSYESNFAGCNVSVVVGPCSSELPSPYNCEKVTSVGVVPLANLMSSVQKRQVSSNEFCYNNAAYHMATGHFDGSLKLWKSTHSHSSNSHSQMVHIPWQLMGVFQTHQGPISMMSLSSCGRKIATISAGQQLEHACTLCIWEIVHVLGSGTLLLEEKLSSDVVITGLNWLTAGNGRLLLGVCAANEFRVYAHRRIISQTLVKSENLLNKYLWVCIAFSQTSLSVHDFCWGPGATPVLIHERYFSLLSKWSFCNNKKHQPKCCSKNTDEENPHGLVCTEKGLVCSVFTDSGTWDDKELSTVGERKNCMSLFSTKLNVKNWSSASKQPHKSSAKIGCWSMLQLAEMLSGPLPVYHPVPLLLNIYSGDWRRAWAAVQHLVECLDSDPHVSCDKARTHNHIIPQIPLSMLFDEPSSTELGDKVLQWGQNVASGSSAEVSQKNSILSFGYNSEANLTTGIYHSTSIKSEISSFSETLEKYHDISGTTSMERTQILAIVDVLDEITGSRRHSVYESFDAPGRRFWVSVRFQQLHYRRRFGRLATMEELVVDSELMGWAHHSDCQESLCSSTLSDEPTWQEMRNLGVGFWFTDSMHLRKRMEKLARSQYLKNKDPKDCALLYIALNRLQVLAGLFKISRDEKDKPLAGFLSRNFQEEKNKAAALKNAYVLMGRHQHELASAFFLLGGDPSSAIIVCAKNLGDEQLALVICRLVEGCGGSLEGHLISKFLLPSALERGDHWLASLLEWLIGNYSKSFLRLLGIKLDPLIEQAVSWNVASFSDPKVGQYGVMLAAKTCMKISIGEAKASMLTRWATAVTSIALNRCGLPLEALECVPCSVGTFEGKDSILDDGTDGFLHEILRANNSNWLSGDVALYLESNLKLSLASQYISNLIKEHPNWPYLMLTSSWVFDTENRACHCRPSVENFNLKLKAVLTTFERKYSLSPALLMNMILVFSYNNGLLFHGYHVLHGCISQEHSHYTSTTLSSVLHPPLPQLFLNAVEECEHFVARYIVACSIIPGSYRSSQLHALNLYTEGLICALKSLRDVLKIYCPGILSEDLSMKASMVIELTEYYVFLVSMWIQRNIRGLTLMISPMLSKREGEHSPEVDLKNLKSACRKTRSMIHRSLGGLVVGFPITNCSRLPNEECSNLDDERWQPIGACIWKNLAHFNREHLKPVPDIVEVNCRAKVPPRLSSLTFNYEAFASDAISVRLRSFDQMPETLSKMLISTFECISTSLATQMQSFLSLKLERGLSENLLVWLEESMKSQSTALYDHLNQETDDVEIIVDRNRSSLLEILWQISIRSKEIREWFLKEQMNTLRSISENSFKGWRDLYECISTESKNGERTSIGQDAGVATTFSKGDAVVPIVRKHSENSSSPCSSQKNLTEVAYFQNPEVIYKRNGELIEVMCINSVDHRQAAVASNRKGLAYFTCKDEEPSDYHSEFVWSEADWPRDGWACSESTPIPTPVSPGIGLGGKGVHLGLGGATIGVKSLARPGRDLTGGGAFGIPGYAGIGASGLGWGIQEDFEEFVDPPATVDNVHSRALSSHPSRPFFLVGSSNTHVYLWEFCNEKATATYGMLPAANVPPPYALASISALQFGPCGHRFATGALDGTVCTWQLEVGGRSNIPPTESSLCFNSHASDISYVAASGSVIAAAGHSSNDVNVVIWDTLAPPTTSQASLTCHQGGARSISVFDNDIGSGSISPLIVTGGTGGDVALHDFRFIATGKTKQHRHPNMGDVNIKYSAIDGGQSGNSHKVGEIPKGMLWYIPKAHLGSVTRIATIPNTSLFLTGSKDGDVKLWDAARAKLVFHWPKLHERHTFLQPSSRGFGGIVRAAVTDIQVLRNGFLTCGGDGTVKMIKFNMTKS